MLASCAASPSAVQNVRERKWSGFNGTPLSTGKIIRLNVQCFGAFWVATVQLAVNAYIVPDGAMAHEILLGTDSWARFPVREYKDIGNHETILTLRTTQHEDRFRESFSESTRMTAYTECAFQNGSEHKIVFDGEKTVQFKHDNRYWRTVRVETGRGWKVSKGLYYARLSDAWSSTEVVVNASGCQLPLAPLANISLSPGKILSASVVSLTKLEWDDVAVHPEPRLYVNSVKPQGPENAPSKEPPPEVTQDMSVEQQAAFLRLWNKIPPHLHDIRFGIRHHDWGVPDLDKGQMRF